MSDVSQGPGWWQASDGKWYAPELYPKDWPVPNAGSTDTTGSNAADSAEATSVEEASVAVSDAASIEVVEDSPAEPSTVPIVDVGDQPSATPADAIEVIEDTETDESASVFGASAEAPKSEPPSGWSAPDPAAGEPTIVSGIPPVVSDPTRVQPVVDPTTEPPQGPPTDWDAIQDQPPLVQRAPSVPPMAAPEPSVKAAASDTPSGLLALLGGLGLVVGSFFAWAKAAGTLTDGTVNGLTGSNGWGTLVCGLLAAGGASLLFAGVREWWVGAGISAAAAVGVGLAIFSLIDIGSTSDDLSAVLQAEGVAAVTADGAKLDLDLGIWIVLAGGVVALVGGLIALARRA